MTQRGSASSARPSASAKACSGPPAMTIAAAATAASAPGTAGRRASGGPARGGGGEAGGGGGGGGEDEVRSGVGGSGHGCSLSHGASQRCAVRFFAAGARSDACGDETHGRQ